MGYIGAGVTRFNTADGLTVSGDAQIDTNTLVVDSTNNRVGVGTASPTTALDVAGTVTADGLTVDSSTGITVNGPSSSDGKLNLVAYAGTQNAEARILAARGATSGTDSRLKFYTNNGTSLVQRVDIDDTGDISFYEDTGTTPKFFWDASAESLGIGTSSPSHPLTIQATGTSGNSLKIIGDSTNSTGRILWRNTSDTNETGRISVDGSSNMTFLGYNGAERMRIDSSGNVGIGESDPLVRLHIKDGNKAFDTYGNINVFTSDTSATDVGGAIALGGENAQGTSPYVFGKIKAAKEAGGTWNGYLAFGTTQSNSAVVEAMRIDSSGNVGIGTSSPATALDVSGTINVRTTSGYQFGRITTNNVDANNGGLTFQTISGGSFSERMRIDSSGNLLVGKTSSALSGAGISLLSTGRGRFTFDNFEVLELNRLTSDGDIIKFFKDGTAVGSIGVKNGQGTFGTGDTGFITDAGSDAIYPWRVDTNASRDNAVSLGAAGVRFKDLYLSGGAYLGGTGSANHLDDYEEGTWTPVVSDATSGGNTASTNTAEGSYTKIGRLVTINLNITDINTSGMGSGNFYIQGLPFTSNSSAGTSSGTMLFNNITLASDETGGIAFQILEGISYLRPVAMENDGGIKNVLNSSQLTSGTAGISGSITYMT